MIVIGTFKPALPINSFTIPILQDKVGRFFLQQELNNKIIGFVSIELNEQHIIKIESEIKIKIGGAVILCFITEYNKLIVGTVNNIKDQLFQYLKDESFDPVAKLIISSRFLLHGKTSELVEECNRLFQKDEINCKLNQKNYIKSKKIGDNITDNFTITEILSECNFLQQKYSFIQWKDFFSIINKIIYLNDWEIDFDNFFDLINSNHEIQKKYIVAIIELILDKVENNDIEKNTIEDNKNFYVTLLMNEFDQSKIDRILSPSIKSYIKQGEGPLDSVIVRCFNLENTFIAKDFTDDDEHSKQDFNRFIEIAENIKRTITLKGYVSEE